MTMSTIVFGAALTLVFYLALYVVFRNGPGRQPSYRPKVNFSTYDGGHDGLGQSAGKWGGMENPDNSELNVDRGG